jgi:hypothetical protein
MAIACRIPALLGHEIRRRSGVWLICVLTGLTASSRAPAARVLARAAQAARELPKADY